MGRPISEAFCPVSRADPSGDAKYTKMFNIQICIHYKRPIGPKPYE